VNKKGLPKLLMGQPLFCLPTLSDKKSFHIAKDFCDRFARSDKFLTACLLKYELGGDMRKPGLDRQPCFGMIWQ